MFLIIIIYRKIRTTWMSSVPCDIFRSSRNIFFLFLIVNQLISAENTWTVFHTVTIFFSVIKFVGLQAISWLIAHLWAWHSSGFLQYVNVRKLSSWSLSTSLTIAKTTVQCQLVKLITLLRFQCRALKETEMVEISL